MFIHERKPSLSDHVYEYIAQHGNVEMLDWLSARDREFSVTDLGETALEAAGASGNVDFIKRIQTLAAQSNTDNGFTEPPGDDDDDGWGLYADPNWSMLEGAGRAGKLDCVSYLVEECGTSLPGQLYLRDAESLWPERLWPADMMRW